MSAAGVGVIPLWKRGPEPAEDTGGSGGSGASLAFANSQSALASDGDITSGTNIKHLQTSVAGSRYNHTYRVGNTFVQTDGSGNYISEIAAQMFKWDASGEPSTVDFAQDMNSPYVGVYPSPQTEGPVEDAFEEIIKAAAGAANPYVGVALTGATIANNLLNWIGDKTDNPNVKRWDWAHYGALESKKKKVGNQMDPVIRHKTSDDVNWSIRTVADSLGNECTFYSGDPPDLLGEPADPGDFSLPTAYKSSTCEDNDGPKGKEENSCKVISHTKGLDSKEDFHSLPHPADMTRKERKKYGVRDPSENEINAFGAPQEEPDAVIDNYPMTIVGEPHQES
nr:hypothetical protein QSJ49_01060 [Halobacterium salinarum]